MDDGLDGAGLMEVAADVALEVSVVRSEPDHAREIGARGRTPHPDPLRVEAVFGAVLPAASARRP